LAINCGYFISKRRSRQSYPSSLNAGCSYPFCRISQAGIITGAQITVNPKALGYDVCCFIGINLKSAGDYPAAIAKLNALEEVVEAYYTTGNYSIFVKVMCQSIDGLQHVLINRIQSIDEIQSTETLISLQNPITRSVKP
jgi:Lrp/AsnC family transcriptional regulator for asnA, asnC and gidA